MAQVRIWIHGVWGTKSRIPYMQNKSRRTSLFKEAVRNYLKKQEEHHRKKSFEEECQLFIEKYGLIRVLG